MTDHDHEAARRRPIRMCARCERITEAPILVHEHHAATGPGFNVYACPECAEHYPPQANAMDLLAPVSHPQGDSDVEPQALVP